MNWIGKPSISYRTGALGGSLHYDILNVLGYREIWDYSLGLKSVFLEFEWRLLPPLKV